MGFDTFVLGMLTLVTYLCCAGQITQKETSYPHRYFIIAGSAQGLSSLLFLYASSGMRTAPYLQALLGNFHIPLTFTARYVFKNITFGHITIKKEKGVIIIAKFIQGCPLLKYHTKMAVGRN